MFWWLAKRSKAGFRPERDFESSTLSAIRRVQAVKGVSVTSVCAGSNPVPPTRLLALVRNHQGSLKSKHANCTVKTSDERKQQAVPIKRDKRCLMREK